MTETKRYNLNLPQELYDAVQVIADKRGITVVQVLRQFIKLGLILESSPDATLIIRTGETEREIILL